MSPATRPLAASPFFFPPTRDLPPDLAPPRRPAPRPAGAESDDVCAAADFAPRWWPAPLTDEA